MKKTTLFITLPFLIITMSTITLHGQPEDFIVAPGGPGYEEPIIAPGGPGHEQHIIAPGGPGWAPTGPGFGPAAGGPGFPGMAPGTMPTEQEIEQWQKEVNSEIDAFVKTLTPEQQAKFDKDVKELTEVMNKMSDQELVEFLGNVFPEEMMQPGAQPAAPAPVQEEVTEQPFVEEKEKTTTPEVSAAQLEKATRLLTNLITRTERFLRKSHQIHELSGKIQQWVAADKIKEWQIDLTWNKLKKEIDGLNHRFHMFKESVDPKTKKSRYLPELIKDEALYNNLSKLSSDLTSYESKVEAPEFGAGKVSKESFNSIKEVVGSFAEAIYTMQIPQEMDKIIEKYEPRAKELRTEEETHRKRALEEVKKGVPPSPAVVATSPRVGAGKGPGTGNFGAGEQPAYGGGAYYPAPSYGGGYDYYPSASEPYYGGGYTPQPAAPGAPAASGGGHDHGGGGYHAGGGHDHGGHAAHGGPEKHGHAGFDEEFEEEPAQAGTKKDGGAKKKKAEPFKEDAEAGQLLKNFERNINHVKDTIADTRGFTDIEKQIRDSAAVTRKDTELVRGIESVARYLTKCIDNIKGFKLRLGKLTPAQADHYTERASLELKEPAPLIHSIKEQIESLNKNQAGITPEKQHAYLGGKAVATASTAAPTAAQEEAEGEGEETTPAPTPAAPTTKAAVRIETPANVFELLATIEKFEKEVEPFWKAKPKVRVGSLPTPAHHM